MAEASREKSYVLENAEKGAFCTCWGQKWGLSVYPAYGIDKIQFSFIEKGAKGKGDSFNVYMDVIKDGAACFDSWAQDILDGMLFRVLKAEKEAGEKYPKTYIYKTGSNAEKSVGITNSTIGEDLYTVNASIPGPVGKDGKATKIYANIPVGRSDLIRLARRFKATYAAREEELNAIIMKVMKDNEEDVEKRRGKAGKPAAKPAAETEPKQEPGQEKPEPEKAAGPAGNTAVQIELRTTSPMTEMKNGKDLAIQAVTESGETKNIIFRQKAISRIEPAYWSSFIKKTGSKKGCRFTGRFTVTAKGNLEFIGFPKAQ